jgi:hypothetical protein
MNVLKVDVCYNVPHNYTGIAELHTGSKYWYLNGQRHRLDGPAIEFKNGSKEWWFNGKKHREDGPAIEDSNGHKAWYLNGINYSQEEWFELLSEEDKLNAIWNLR